MSKQTTRIKFWLIRSLLFLSGMVLGLVAPWYAYINHVTTTIARDRFEVPSVIYARALELFPERRLSAKALNYELDVLGYQPVKGTPQVGQYRQQGSHYEIYAKGFHFPDGTEQPTRIKLNLNNNRISHITPSLARLEPKIIGHFFNRDFENRRPIALDDIPDTLVMGLQAVEDREFKHHHGVSWSGIARAAMKNMMAGRIVQGGSTLTQQLVKNKLHYDEQTFLRKLHELLAATLLENKLTKHEILAMYFNEIYWGQNGRVAIHGVVEAARFYFAKNVHQLTIAEQATLIGLIKGPSWYNPYKHPKRATQRRNVVLNSWLETGIIDTKSHKAAINSPLQLSQSRQIKGDYDNYIDVVKRQIRDRFSSSDLKQKGLRIFTHLDPYIQYRTSQTAHKTDQWLSDQLETAIIVSSSQSGGLLALTGSKNPHSQYNRALLAKRQIGSLIKPFIYLAALEILPGFDLNNKLHDGPISIRTPQGPWQPENWDNLGLGDITAMEALVQSRNQATVDLGVKIGLDRLLTFLNKLGLNIQHNAHPALFLGALELTPFEVQHLFSLFASRGNTRHINAIISITDHNNHILSRAIQPGKQSISVAHIDTINTALNAITTRGTARRLTTTFNLPEPLFGKTGTTNNGRDSWFSGFNQDYLMTVWVGRDDNKPTPYSGSNGALILWANLFKNL